MAGHHHHHEHSGTKLVAEAEAVLTAAGEQWTGLRQDVFEALAGQDRPVSAYDIARHHRDEVVPLSKRISEESLLRYNGMLISVFELLADSREQIASVTGYVGALRDFWAAETQLQTELTGRSPGASPAARASSAAAAPAAGGH